MKFSEFITEQKNTHSIIEGDSAGDVFCVSITPTTNNDDALCSLNWQNHTA